MCYSLIHYFKKNLHRSNISPLSIGCKDIAPLGGGHYKLPSLSHKGLEDLKILLSVSRR